VSGVRQRVRLRTRLRERKRRLGFSNPRGEFWHPYYLRHNQRRQEHLASLGLEIAGKTVLEVGAGIGDHTSFFVDRGCTVTSSDARATNVEIIRSRYPDIDVAVIDLDRPPAAIEPAEVVYCYGVLYHLQEPERAIEFLGRATSGLLLLETCVSRGSDEALNPMDEDANNPTQSASGRGCRPTRPWVLARLRENFPYAYVTTTQPWLPEFPIDWTEDRKGNTHAVFVASRTQLDSPVLVTAAPDHQMHH
jgi:SAM-dependent methyltransferase